MKTRERSAYRAGYLVLKHQELQRTATDDINFTHIAHLLTDLMHLCNAEGVDFEATLRLSRESYQNEAEH